jgi:predicted DCC family thiol-disulfide oxidoreductase YuxK
MDTLTLFYDGACPLCSREIAHYRHAAREHDDIRFVDVADPAFSAAEYGLDTSRVHFEMHVKEGERVLVGVDALLAIWRRVPGHRWLLSLARLPLADLLMRMGYALFVRIRPWLPRRKADCEAGVCRR